MRRSLLTLAVALVAASVTVVAPAQAYSIPTFSGLDVSTPGHAQVTVTTDAPYVALWLRSDQEQVGTETYDIDLGEPVVQPTANGQATVDVETWGVDSGRFVARTCNDGSIGNCGALVTAAPSTFTPTDVAPAATWPDDTSIGNDETYSVTATDPDGGGGDLVASWDVDQYSGPERTSLIRGEPAVLPLSDDGTAPIVIQRCSSLDWRVCHDTPTQHVVKVNKWVSSYVETTWLGELNPALGTALEPVITTYEGQDFTLSWQVEDSATSQPVAGASGTLTGLAADAGGQVRPVIDPSAVTGDKDFVLRMTLSYVDPDVGTVSSDLTPVGFRVDSVATPITGISAGRRELYPYRDYYQDSVAITVTRPWGDVEMRLEIRNAAGAVVKTFVVPTTYSDGHFVWRGRDTAGRLVPAGVYTFKATLTDRAGNVSTRTQGSVTVVRKKLLYGLFKRTYSAKGSLLKKVVVGACSTLASPSKRGWAGSLGYYSNNKCSRTVNASVIETRHVARVPEALSYGELRISMYGGAARGAGQSVSYLAYLNNSGRFTTTALMAPEVGIHVGPYASGEKVVFPGRWVAWDVLNLRGSRYDVKSFTVRLRYKALVPE